MPTPAAIVSSWVARTGSALRTGASTTDAYNPLPGGENHARPRSPRPAVCRSATTTEPSGKVAATSLVDVVTARRVMRSNTLDFEADIDGRRRMGERADRDEVGAGFRELGNPFERHAAGDFDLCAARGSRHRRADLRGGHIVNEYRVGAPVQRLVDLRQCLRFDLDRQIGMRPASSIDRRGDTTGEPHVVVLDEHRVEQPDAMIRRAAHAHRVL